MTICVAAICDSGEAIVTASDMSLSTGYFSSDLLTIKIERIGKTWHALFSGDDISPVAPIVREVNERFSDQENTIEQIKISFEDAYQNCLRHKINTTILGRYGLDLEMLKQTGLKQLGRDVFNSIWRQIDSVHFDCEFLICGFDKNGASHIFTVSDVGTMEYSQAGFWAIGSGATSALSVLFFHGLHRATELAEVIYHVCEAKFMAESALGVGQSTLALVIHPNEEPKVIEEYLMQEIKSAWIMEGQPKLPKDIIHEIESFLQNKKN